VRPSLAHCIVQGGCGGILAFTQAFRGFKDCHMGLGAAGVHATSRNTNQLINLRLHQKLLQVSTMCLPLHMPCLLLTMAGMPA
jgi:hypothetical protein